jgi:hypothetical protein
MKVSVIWLGIFLIGILCIGVLWKGKGVYEAFTTEQKEPMEPMEPMEEGFAGSLDDLQVSSCPANSKQFIDNNGIVLCCDGTVSDGKCQGKTICSLSEGSAQYPTCSTWMAAYLNEKGRNRCPPSMPNYYESRDGKVKGCTSGRRNKDGSGPITQNQKFCKLYSSKLSEDREIDSCTNIRMLENTKCFSRDLPNVNKTLVKPWWNSTAPAYVTCSYVEPGTMSTSECWSNDSLNRLINNLIETGYLPRNFKQNMDPWTKLLFCSITEKVKINKTLAFNDLNKTPVP